MNKVWLIEEQNKDAMAQSNNSLWLTHKMALKHALELAKTEAAFLSADLAVETRWTHEPLDAPNRILGKALSDVIIVEVKAADDVWFVRMKYFVSEWTIQGDAVSALAEVAP